MSSDPSLCSGQGANGRIEGVMDMTGRMIAVAICIAALFGAGAARGQENLDHGKTPAQLFASDCAICHKSARGL
jgi:mono/diheme cytochrome c family protein